MFKKNQIFNYAITVQEPIRTDNTQKFRQKTWTGELIAKTEEQAVNLLFNHFAIQNTKAIVINYQVIPFDKLPKEGYITTEHLGNTNYFQEFTPKGAEKF